jgi:hypothetical protein
MSLDYYLILLISESNLAVNQAIVLHQVPYFICTVLLFLRIPNTLDEQVPCRNYFDLEHRLTRGTGKFTFGASLKLYSVYTSLLSTHASLLKRFTLSFVQW